MVNLSESEGAYLTFDVESLAWSAGFLWSSVMCAMRVMRGANRNSGSELFGYGEQQGCLFEAHKALKSETGFQKDMPADHVVWGQGDSFAKTFQTLYGFRFKSKHLIAAFASYPE